MKLTVPAYGVVVYTLGPIEWREICRVSDTDWLSALSGGKYAN